MVVTPISLYYAWKLWQFHKQNIPFFSKRHPKLVILSVIGFNMYTSIIRPVMEYTGCRFGNCEMRRNFYHLLLGGSAQICLALVFSRIWILYYDHQHKLDALNFKWMSHIIQDQTLAIVSDWTIRYKWTGNMKFVISITVSIAIIFTLLTVVLYMKASEYALYLPAVWSIPIIILHVKIRRFRDEFCLRSSVNISHYEFVFFFPINQVT